MAEEPILLDGRGKTQMAGQAALDSEEHRGSFYWMVTRTSNITEANMTLDNVTFEHQVKVSLPKRRM